MRRPLPHCATLVMLALTPAIAADEPRFDDFQVREIYKGRTHFPDFKGRDPEFAVFRTRIRNGLKDGPDFAGHYSVIQIGCGSSCRNVYIADNQTGRVFPFPRGGEDNLSLGLAFKIDSRLIITQWVDYEGGVCKLEYFEWYNKQAKLLDTKVLGKKENCYAREASDPIAPSTEIKTTEQQLAQCKAAAITKHEPQTDGTWGELPSLFVGDCRF